MAKSEPIVVDGVTYRRVTEIIDLLGANKRGLMQWANYLGKQGIYHEDASTEAARLGTAVHARIEDALHGRPQRPVDGQDPFVDPVERDSLTLFEAWMTSWARGREFDPIAIERRLYLPSCEITGSPDFIAREDGRVWCYDWKTSGDDEPKLEHWIQQGAYAALIEHDGITQHGACVVVLNKKTHRVTEHRKTVQELQPYRDLFWCLSEISDTLKGIP